MAPVMRLGEEAKTTLNNYVYSRAIKKLRASRRQISCSWCPYHWNENMTNCQSSFTRQARAVRSMHNYYVARPKHGGSWKDKTRNKSQWMHRSTSNH